MRNYYTGPNEGCFRLSTLLLLVIISIPFVVEAKDIKYEVAADGKVEGYFTGGSASYNTDFNILSDRFVGITPTVNNQTAYVGQHFDFKTYSAGDDIMFMLTVNNNSDQWFSRHTLNNDDGFEHFYTSAFNLADGTPALYVSAEDMRFGSLGFDGDMNDSGMIFTNIIQSPVPEPETYMMMLLGLGLIFAARKKLVS